MTYRRFLKLYRRGRQEATPSLSIRTTNRQPVLRRVTAIAAVALLLAGGGWLWQRGGQPPVDKEPIRNEDPGVDGVAPPYLTETVHVTPALHAGTPLDTIVTADGTPTALSVIPFDYRDTMNENHEACSGVYYNAASRTLFCCTHAVRELLQEQGIAGEQVRVKYFSPSLGKVLFTLDDQPGHPSYCGDFATDTLLPVAADLYATGTWMGGTDVAAVPYALLFAMDDTNALSLIDLNTAEVRRLSDTYPAMDDATLTRGGQYVYYTVQNDPCNPPARTTVLYTIADGTFRTFVGEVLDGYPTDSTLIVRTPEGVRAYNCTTGEMQTTEQAAVPREYLYGIRRTDAYTSFAWKLEVEDYTTGEVQPLDVGYVEASVRSADRRSLYYYCRGENVIHVWDLLAGQERTVPVDPRLVQETEGEETAGYNVAFTLMLSQTDDLLLQYVVTSVPRQDPDAVQQEIEGSAYWQYHQWHEQNPHGTIASMETLLKNFPDGVVAYEGDGFLYLDYTEWIGLSPDGEGDRTAIYVLLEDYRDGYGYRLAHNWGTFTSPFYVSGDGYRLPEGAEAAARTALSTAGIPILPAERDYGPYLSDGQQSELKSCLDSYQTENLMAQSNAYFLFKTNDTEGGSGDRWALESSQDMEELERFLKMSDSLTYTKHMGNTSEYVSYGHHSEYYIDLTESASTRCRIYVGRMDGKPFLVKGGCLATLTEEQYREAIDWMEGQYPKTFYEPQY